MRLAHPAVNFLAHYWLAHRRGLPLPGALLGEWVRGRLDGRYPEPLRRSILFHRLVDAATDRHPEVVRLRACFAQGERRYAGIILDVVFDHALALGWERYEPATPLAAFAHRCDMETLQAWEYFLSLGRPPPRAGALEELLRSYATGPGIDEALRRIGARLSRPQRFEAVARAWRPHLPAAAGVLPVLLESLRALEPG